MNTIISLVPLVGPLQGGIVPRGSRRAVFEEIFVVFLLLGTVIGVVVIAYMLYNGYKYRDSRDREPDEDIEQPELGELPEGGGGGRKLFLSLTVSAIIVISLIAWTYGTLLYVEGEPASPSQEGLNVNVTGYRFGWQFEYPNGYTTTGTLRVPRGERITLTLTAEDVIHNFGVPELRFKADAFPGMKTDTWFKPSETGTYRAQCFEFCGAGHSAMDATVIVMEPRAFERWYANTTPANATTNSTTNTNTTTTTAA